MLNRETKKNNPSLIKSKSLAWKFIEEVESVVKKLNPYYYALFAKKRLIRSLSDIKYAIKSPPHFILNSIEFCCAFHRKTHSNHTDEKKFFEIMRIFKQYKDPFVEFASLKDIDYALSYQMCLQLPIQHVYGRYDIARGLAIFHNNDPIPLCAESFMEKFGYSIRDWFYMHWIIHAIQFDSRNLNNVFSDSFLLNANISSLPKDSVKPFLKFISIDVPEIKTIINKRKISNPHLILSYPSIFIEHPVIHFDNGKYMVVHDEYLLNNSWAGLIKIMRQWEEFSSEMKGSFHAYVKRVTRDILPDTIIHGDREIEKLSLGRSCDFIFEFKDCILLVECKSIIYAKELFTEEAKKHDTSAHKIVDGIIQIISTANNIRNGRYGELFEGSGKDLYAIILTFGYIPSANSDEFWNSIITPALTAKDSHHDKSISVLKYKPQIFDIRSYEWLLLIAATKSGEISKILDEKLIEPYHTVGDWPLYLERKLPREYNIKFLDNILENFFNWFKD
ncbi:hypothetical protein CEE37_15055 [candidate division LCP-89 bacterium B3_LCP]|uniref:Uncharacterized protein n=1 Tax=candidate division LCP-89 bacterium B3_LCP TaxID=2012998 RepID=A0A532UNU3_UNCL8|nr:MAG: hypothetical protein CEE37_15055 [candidate division LCP-89 bacterium B3_LCP]